MYNQVHGLSLDLIYQAFGAVVLRIDELVVYTTIRDVSQAFEPTKCG